MIWSANLHRILGIVDDPRDSVLIPVYRDLLSLYFDVSTNVLHDLALGHGIDSYPEEEHETHIVKVVGFFF